MEYNRKKLDSYLTMYPVNEIRSRTITLVLVLADLFVIIPVFANPFQALYEYIIVPPIVFLNLWAIPIIIKPNRWRLQYILFRGVFGVIVSLCLMLLTQKFAYGMLHLKTPLYFIFSFAAYGLGLYQYYKYHIKKLKEDPKKSKDSKGSRVNVSMFTGLGYLIANIILGIYSSDKITAIVLMTIFSMIAFILFHFIMELHKYYHFKKMKIIVEKEVKL